MGLLFPADRSHPDRRSLFRLAVFWLSLGEPLRKPAARQRAAGWLGRRNTDLASGVRSGSRSMAVGEPEFLIRSRARERLP